jgi:hypothetical protein
MWKIVPKKAELKELAVMKRLHRERKASSRVTLMTGRVKK